nr:S-layer family protein [Xenococcaceae cyanobacterium MO_234.B1]
MGSPTILPTATSADINIGGIAMLGSLAADGVILLTNQYQPNTSLAGGNIEFGAIITTDQASGILSELPAGLRSELESFDLLNGFSGNSSDVIVDSRNSIKMVGNDLAELGLDFGLLNTSSSSGDAGDITLIANDAVSLANSFVSSDTFGTGNGGDITISANSVSVTDGTVISTSFSKGQEGRLNIDASESVELVGSALLSLAIGSGDAGEVTIKTKSLIIRDNSVITTSSLNRSNAGDLKVEVDHLIIQDGILATNTGFSPNLNPDLRTDSGKGQGGDIIIRASDFVDLTATTEDGRIFPLDTPILNDFLGVFFEEPSEITSIGTFTGLFSTAERGSQGDAGNIIITTGRLNIQGGAQASTSTLGQGQGGDLIVNASESVELIGTSINESFSSALEAETFDFGTGGNIIINTPKLIVQDGAVVSASARSLAERFGTDSIGKAGNLTVTANWVELSGTSAALKTPSALQTSTAGAGVGGNLLIDTNRLIVRDGAAIAVNSEGISEAGSIEIKADSLTLNKGFITAETASNQGGNITLEIQDTLQFIDSGEITATAGTVQGPGDGGNIKINADFILAFPTDNTYKITANAFKGNGGNIQITTKGFFGAEFVDISASSEEGLEGVVSIDILEVNPAQSLTELPSNIVDASRLIAKSCLAGGAMAEEQNEFVVTGRGGLPANPK